MVITEGIRKELTVNQEPLGPQEEAIRLSQPW
jgi:hypothetical protein